MTDSEYTHDEMAIQDADAQISSARPVPYISVHAFCDDQNTAAAVYAMAQDRRMSKAHVSVEMGGLAGAYAWFAANPTPNLIIIETMLDSQSMLAQLDQLATVCDENTKVIMIGHMNDVLLYRQLMQRGVSEYIVAPIQPIQVMESISNLFTDPDTGPIGEVIAFIGAKGGGGSSTVCHNAAWALSESVGKDVVIADYDLAYGTSGLNFNRDPVQGIADALLAPDRLDEVLLERLLDKCTEYLSLFAPPSTLDKTYDITPDASDRVITVLRNNIPYVAVDVPNSWNAWTEQMLLHADQVVITAEPDLANLRNTKNLVEVITSARDNDKPPVLVMNKIGVPKRPEIPVADFASAIGIQPRTVLDFDANLFGTAANNGQMIGEVSVKAKAAESFRQLSNYLSHSMQSKVEKKSVLSPLFDKLNIKKAG